MSRDDYIEVKDRIIEFLAAYPTGSLQSEPPVFMELDGRQVVMIRAAAYRSPDDPRPGIGTAWELIPGSTPFTRGSEVMVCETSAWGRAIVALGIAAHKGVASADEVRAANARRDTHNAQVNAAASIGANHAPNADTYTGGAANPPTDKQRRLLAKLWADCGVDTAEFRRLMMAKMLGKPDVTFVDITRADASRMIDALTEWVRTGEPPLAGNAGGGGTLGGFLND